MKKLIYAFAVMAIATLVVGCAKEETEKYIGEVLEVRDGEFELNYENEGKKDTIIVLTKENVEKGDKVKVETDGTMMLSYPARVNANKVEIVEKGTNDKDVTLTGLFLEYSEDNFIIISEEEPREGDMVFTYKVNISEVENMPTLVEGDKLLITYNGNMTRSIQPMLNAKKVEVLSHYTSSDNN